MSETTMGCCPNQHEHELAEDNVIADYGKLWRVRCITCRIIFSVAKMQAPVKKADRDKEEA
jgi:hypothetical protein